MAIRASISYAALQASVSSAKPAASITYELANAAGIWTDHDSKNRFFTEEVPLSDVRFNLVEKNLVDTTVMQDVPVWHFTKSTTPEVINIADTFINVVAYKRHFTDAFTLDDLSQVDKDFYGNKGNIFAFTDVIGLTYNKVFTNDYTVSDVITAVVAYSRTFTEILTYSDNNVLDVSKVATDDMSLAELKETLLSKPITDGTSVGDSSYKETQLGKSNLFSFSDTHTATFSKIVTDSFVLDDASLIDKDYYGSKGNIFGISDVFAAEVAYRRTITDSYTMGDSTTMLHSKAFPDTVAFVEVVGMASYKALSNSANINDILTLQQNKLVNDSYGFTDSNLFNIDKTITDGFGLDDAALVNKNYNGTKGNVVGVSDVVAINHLRSKALNATTLNTMSLN